MFQNETLLVSLLPKLLTFSIDIMNLQDIFSQTKQEDIILKLKNKSLEVPSWSTLVQQYDSRLHDVCLKSKRPNKPRKGKKDDEVARIHLSLEKLVVKRMTEFMFAIPVKRTYSNFKEDDKDYQAIVKAIEAIYKKSRVNKENIVRARELFASCEVASFWYPIQDKNKYYGFESKLKLRCKTYSPKNGYKLYPLFDEFDDLIAMSVEYQKSDGEKVHNYFDTWTKDKHYLWRDNILETDEANTLGKIPYIYSHREEPIWEGVQHIVKELEWTLSRNSDVIAYNSAPVLQIVGEVKGAEEKGETNRVYRVENGGSVAYVSWMQSIEAIKFQIDTLLRLFWIILQLPDISLENIKGLGAVSGEARKTLLTDAHLKVGDEKDAFIEFFEREASIVKEYLKIMEPKWKDKIDDIDIEHEITPFIQNDEVAEIEKLIKANGGKALLSHLESIKSLGWSADPNQTLEDIRQDESLAAKNSLTTNLFSAAE